MTEWVRGDVVLVLYGHDTGRFETVVAVGEDGWLSLADGKRRKLTAPKRKNPKHLRHVGPRLEETALTTDRQLRRALHPYNYGEQAVRVTMGTDETAGCNCCEKE